MECSVLGFWCRAEIPSRLHEFKSVNEKGILKEIRASQSEDNSQQLNYRPLFDTALHEAVHIGFPTRGRLDGVPQEMLSIFRSNLFKLKESLETNTRLVFFPMYNTRKNVSGETMDNYLEAHGEPRGSRRDVSSATILRHYHKTGVQIPGRLELRVAWRFNELKSRTYYCMGGDAFWDSYFLKDITFMLLGLLPCTHPFSRYEVQRIGRLPDGAVLITYDYESFTTRLAELKYFLWYLASDLEDIEVQVLDVREGVRVLSLGELLHHYNESINRNQEFYTKLINISPDVNFCQA